MPLSISSAAILEKNKLASSDPWLLLVEIAYPLQPSIRVVCNTENLATWNGYTWYAVPFALGDQEESREANSSNVSLTLVDIERRLIPTIDTYGGGVGATVTIRIVHSAHLDNLVPELEAEFEILDVSINHQCAVKFSLGSENLSNRRSPPEICLQGHCRYKAFKGAYCQYTGAQSSCDRTFERCRQLENQLHFGGFPGIGNMGYHQ